MRLLLTTLFVSLTLAAQSPTPKPQPKPQATPTATIGKAAPHFRVNDQTGSLTKFGGAAENKNWTVLAFYPKAATGG